MIYSTKWIGKFLLFLGIRDEDTVVLWGMSRDLFGQYLMSVGKHEKARDQFKQAYEVSLEINGETDEQTLVLLNSLGRNNNGNVYLNKN